MSPRKAKRRPKHLKALETPYEVYAAMNGGEFCAICGALPKTRRLHRDHDHHTGLPRGLLCARCNRALPSWITSAWLLKAVAYLDKSSPTTVS